jgi:hypothetical protein
MFTETYWSEVENLFKIVLECVNRDFEGPPIHFYIIFLISFTLTAEKMANTIAHKRTILKVKKPVRFLVRPRAINFFVKKS